MTMQRRTVLAGLAGLGAAGLAARARAAEAVLRVSTAAPPADFLAKACESFRAQVEGANAGLKVEVHPASTLFRQGTEVPALQRGNLEMSTMTTFEVAQQIPEFGFLNRAYLFREYAHMRKVFDGPIGAAYRKAVAEKMGIEILSTAYLGTRQVALRGKRKVAGPEDLAGVKLCACRAGRTGCCSAARLASRRCRWACRKSISRSRPAPSTGRRIRSRSSTPPSSTR